MRILGIETSCDDTGVAVYDTIQGLLAHALYSQITLHSEYGGIVPELAARDHIRKIIPLVDVVLDDASCESHKITGVAYTAGPGLAGSLLAGSAVAKGLAFAWQVPAIGIHHMEGHLLAPLLEVETLKFPFVALLVSGGHTILAKVDRIGKYLILGQTLDDAVGEAFDKVAKILGLGYPGGPAIETAALLGDSQRFKFPRPMTDRPGLEFSFSGLKTAVLMTAQQHQLDKQTVADIARAFQDAAVETLLIKCRRALQQTDIKQLIVAGGVGANSRLREKLNTLDARLYFPRIEFCTDNGAMIAYAGALRMHQADQDVGFQVRPRWSLEELPPI